MSSDARILLELIPPGKGLVLDLGGSKGLLRQSVMDRGYRYINLDIQSFGDGEPSLIGDAHRLSFKDGTLDMVVSKDSLEHFENPWSVVKEVDRVLKVGGHFVILVPFMHPFHATDFYRYSPLGLRHLLKNFDIIAFDSPLWVFSVLGIAMIQMLKSIRLNWAEQPIKWLSGWLDQRFSRNKHAPASFAAAYRIVARKPQPTSK